MTTLLQAPRRRFGKTELPMPVFSLGGMRHMHTWKDMKRAPRASSLNVRDCMRRAWELGITHFETARGYGTSELQMGYFLREFARAEMIITTKVTPRADPEEFRRVVFESMKRLKLEYVDILDVHGLNTPEHFEWTMRKGGCLEVLQELRRDGVIHHIGFSTHAPLALILDAINSGAFDAINLHFYFFNQRNWPAVQRARELDMGVFIISPQDKGGMLYRPSERLKALTAPLHPMTFNQLWTLQFPEVHTLSVGASKPGELDDLIPGIELYPELQNAISGMAERITRAMHDRLGATHCEFCHDCLPCPQEIHIPEALRLRNLLVGLDMEEFAKMRYNLFEKGGHWFPGKKATACNECGDCLPRCPVKLDIPTLLFEMHERLAGEPVQRLGSH